MRPGQRNEVLRALPHRFPFLMVDGIRTVEPEHISTFKLVSFNEPQFVGHFPAAPIMPGVLLLEGIAQSAALLARYREEFDPETERLLLTSADKVKFRRPVLPGERIDYDVRLVRGGKIWKARGRVNVDDVEVASAEITAVIRSLAEVGGA